MKTKASEVSQKPWKGDGEMDNGREELRKFHCQSQNPVCWSRNGVLGSMDVWRAHQHGNASSSKRREKKKMLEREN